MKRGSNRAGSPKTRGATAPPAAIARAEYGPRTARKSMVFSSSGNLVANLKFTPVPHTTDPGGAKCKIDPTATRTRAGADSSPRDAISPTIRSTSSGPIRSPKLFTRRDPASPSVERTGFHERTSTHPIRVSNAELIIFSMLSCSVTVRTPGTSLRQHKLTYSLQSSASRLGRRATRSGENDVGSAGQSCFGDLSGLFVVEGVVEEERRLVRGKTSRSSRMEVLTLTIRRKTSTCTTLRSRPLT